MCLAIHSARSLLLSPPTVETRTRRRPQGVASHLLPAQLRAMTARDTDYEGLGTPSEGAPDPPVEATEDSMYRRLRSRPLRRRRPRGQQSIPACWSAPTAPTKTCTPLSPESALHPSQPELPSSPTIPPLPLPLSGPPPSCRRPAKRRAAGKRRGLTARDTSTNERVVPRAQVQELRPADGPAPRGLSGPMLRSSSNPRPTSTPTNTSPTAPQLSFLLHGLSVDATTSLTLDLRAADPVSNPCRNLVLSENLNQLLDDLRGEAGVPASVSTISNYLRQQVAPIFSLSMSLDQSLFSDTNPNGICGYVLAYQLHQRATASPIEGYSPAPLDLWSAAERGRLSTFLRQLSAHTDDFSAAVTHVIEWMSNEHRDPSTTPFLPSYSGLWFRLPWLRLLMGVIPFALFLYDRLDDEFPEGPPSPTGFGPLVWSGDRGPQRRFTVAELAAICSKGNFAALSSSHFHLLPHQPSHTTLQKLDEALSALSTQLHAILLAYPAIRVRWAPTEAVDLDLTDSPDEEGTLGPASSSAHLLSCSEDSGPTLPPSDLVTGSAPSQARSPSPIDTKRSRSPTLTAASQMQSTPGFDRRTRLRRSSSTSAPTQVLRSLETTNKRQRQTTLTHYWRRQAPNEVDIPLMILHSPSDDDGRASSPPPKRGRVGPDGVVRLGIG